MLNRGGWNVRKNGGASSHTCAHVYTLQSTSDVLTRRSLPSFLFWLIFPNRNYKLRPVEYNVNWYWHYTLPLTKKTFPILLLPLLKTLGTTKKVLIFLKIPLPTMLVDRFASCENIVARFLVNSFFPPPPYPRTGLLIPLKKLFNSQCWRVLWQFLFSIMKGWKVN